MDLFLFNEFIEWIDTFDGWMVYLVINGKSITAALQESGDFFLVLSKNRLYFRAFRQNSCCTNDSFCSQAAPPTESVGKKRVQHAIYRSYTSVKATWE